MAYRNLLAACFACGLIAVGCGSGGAGTANATDATTNDVATSGSDHAPVSQDQAPVNKDQPPSSSDQAPVASPGSNSSSDGSGAEAACRAFCDKFGGNDACPGDNGSSSLVRAICNGNGNCMLDPEDVPCEAEAVRILDCLSHLPGLCTTDGPSELDASACQAAIDAAKACEDAHKPVTDPCSMAGGCDCGNDTCKSCRCALGENSPTCDAICM